MNREQPDHAYGRRYVSARIGSNQSPALVPFPEQGMGFQPQMVRPSTVSVTGFEPAASWSPTTRSQTKLSYTLMIHYTTLFTVSTSVGVSSPEGGRPRRFIEYSLREASNLRNAESVCFVGTVGLEPTIFSV